MSDIELEREGLAAQLYKIDNPHGPLWHVLSEDLRRRWRNKAGVYMKAVRVNRNGGDDLASWHVRSVPYFVREYFLRQAFEQRKSVGEVLSDTVRELNAS